MTMKQLKSALGNQPFRPFTICLTDGRQLPVRHPECVLIAPEATRTFIIAESEEDYCIVDLFLVTSIDFVNGKKAGKTKKRR